jgi:uncharacterized membrane protein YkvI
MPDGLFAILLTVVVLFFTGVAITLLIRPSLLLRHFADPLQRDTPENRVQIRGVGIIFCLFVLQIILAAAPPSELLNVFRHNLLVALVG